MKGTLEYFVQEMFGEGTKMRFRPSYFPFTEPSAEVDIWNDKLNQWMEILGCGMVNPNVLANVGYDTKIYQGFNPYILVLTRDYYYAREETFNP